MATFADIEKKITVKIKTLVSAEKENERILSGGKENALIKQQKFIEKRLSEIIDLKYQGQEIMLENDVVSFEEIEDWGGRRVGKQFSWHCGEKWPSDGRNWKQVEIIQRNGKTDCDRAGRKKNGAGENGNAAADEEENRRLD